MSVIFVGIMTHATIGLFFKGTFVTMKKQFNTIIIISFQHHEQLKNHVFTTKTKMHVHINLTAA